MAKPALEHEKIVPDADVIDADYEIDDTIDELEAKAGETGVTYVVRVWRINPGEAEREALCAITPGEFSLEYIRDNFGPGTYDIWVYGNKRVARRFNGRKIGVPLDWEPPKKPSEMAAEAKREDTHQIVEGIKELGNLIFKMNEAQAQREQQNKPEPVTPVDPIAIQNSILAGLGQMKALFAPAQPATDQGTIAFDAFVKGIEIMKEVGGKGDNGGETGLWDVLKTMAAPDGLIGKLTDMAQATDAKLTNPPQLVGPDGRPIPTVAHAVHHPEAGPAQVDPNLEAKRMNFLKMQLAILVQRAKRGSDPALYAELILDTVEPEAVAQFITAPDAIEKLTAINPEVANHQEWFRAVGIHLSQMLAEENETPDGETVNPNTGEGVAPVQTTDSDTPRDTERPGGDTPDA